ncbi:MAG: CGNR zinc finger domain-containing protein [Gemmatimonadales bacterium]
MAEDVLPFKYIGGDPAVDLVNTVDWTREGPKDERLGDYQRLTRWAEGSGVLSPQLGAKLRRRAAGRPTEASAAYRGALRAREILRRLFLELAGGSASPGAVADFNRILAPALQHLRVTPPGTAPRLQLGWENEENRLDSVLWPVLWSAASLISSEEASRIRVCGSEDCGWMYVDRSRNGFRRWCQMESCGTREKTRRRRKGAAAVARS